MIRLNEVKLDLDQAINKELEIKNIIKYINKKYNVGKIDNVSIYKKAIDARRADRVLFVYTVDFSTPNEKQLLGLKQKAFTATPNMDYQEVTQGYIKLTNRPVIVGFGPSGILAGLLLARRGYKPIIIEMGLDIDNRDQKFSEFLATRKFNKHASIQFGEGGAGTYSDGKLTTSISDLRCRYVLKTLVEHGAEEDLIYINKPHVGTDKLKEIIKNIRKEIISLGGEIRFDCKLTDFLIENNTLVGIEINDEEVLKTETLLLGIGHSSRETFELIKNSGFNITRKPFSVGVRIEHPQEMINKSQYGKSYNHPALGAADYKLSYHDPSGRSAYTFCMCPGGYVVCGASEVGGVVTNGMSESKRDNHNANSAVLVNVQTDDFPGDDVLAGMYFQRNLEKIAFEKGGNNYDAPAQLVGDFLTNRRSNTIKSVLPTYKPGVTLVDFNEILPNFVTSTLKNALLDFDKKIKGFAMADAIMTGVETRSSSPVRIIRDNLHEANINGIYPMGEGAGYAGGIMSSAVDGIKTAEFIIQKYANFNK